MLDLIARLKREETVFKLDPEDLNGAISALQATGFLDGATSSFVNAVKCQVLTEQEDLESYAQGGHSCIIDGASDEEIARFADYLKDPGALYVGVEGTGHMGYFRLYAGELQNSTGQVLFEDVMRVKPKRFRDDHNYPLEFKAVSLLAMHAFDRSEDCFIYVPYRRRLYEGAVWAEESGYAGTSLEVRKLGADTFWQNWYRPFYEGKEDRRSPRFANVAELAKGLDV